MISCDECNGACCRYFYITLDRNLQGDRARYLKLHRCIRAGGGKWIVPLPCAWLENGKCMHYADRPSDCVHAKPGDTVCQQARRLYYERV